MVYGSTPTPSPVYYALKEMFDDSECTNDKFIKHYYKLHACTPDQTSVTFDSTTYQWNKNIALYKYGVNGSTCNNFFPNNNTATIQWSYPVQKCTPANGIDIPTAYYRVKILNESEAKKLWNEPQIYSSYDGNNCTGTPYEFHDYSYGECQEHGNRVVNGIVVFYFFSKKLFMYLPLSHLCSIILQLLVFVKIMVKVQVQNVLHWLQKDQHQPHQLQPHQHQPHQHQYHHQNKMVTTLSLRNIPFLMFNFLILILT